MCIRDSVEGADQIASVDNGFLSVEHDRVTIVADHVTVG